jgi:energy-coupling factor transporter ATP-binding protein EcfA2
MMPRLNQFSTVFNTYEEREDAFRRSVVFKLARRYAGPSVFWQDFSRIAHEGITAEENGHVAYIPSNPRDCLAFGTAHQVLIAAAMSTESADPDVMATVLETARSFGIEEQLKQPIRTLSGGETVKLALAKSYVGLSSCSRTIIASPFTWLSAANRHLLETVVAESYRLNKNLSLLILAGEEDLSLISDKDPFITPSPDTVAFSLMLSAVRIPLSLTLNPLVPEARHATIQDTSLQLSSPCLIVGDNGQGKSLVARALAGAIAAKGNAAIISDTKKSGPACLLFQDVLTQTMLRSFAALTSGITRFNREAIFRIYENIRKDFKTALLAFKEANNIRINDWKADSHVLLDIKTVLVATRLASAPAALILDEPDWGMSRQSAIAFVSAVLAAAHRQNTPVLLISHKPWWQTIARSRVLVSRTARKRDDELADPAFSITVTAEEAPH